MEVDWIDTSITWQDMILLSYHTNLHFLARYIIFRQIVRTRASQNFRNYLPHSVLSSEWAGATLVGVSEG